MRLTTGIFAVRALSNATGTSSSGIEPVTIAPALASMPCWMQLAMFAGLDFPSQTSSFTPALPRAASREPLTAWNTGTW